MPVEIRHYDGESRGPWWSYHYHGEKTDLGRGNNGPFYSRDVRVEVTSDSTARVTLNFKDGCVMGARFRQRGGLEDVIDTYRVRREQREIEIDMSVGDQLSFSIPNEVVSIRVHTLT